MASWNWRIASSIWPFSPRAMPRLLWARALFSVTSSACRNRVSPSFQYPSCCRVNARQRTIAATTRHRQRQHLIPPAPGQFVRAPDREDQHPKRRKISIPIRHRLCAHLHQSDHRAPASRQTTATPPANRDAAAAAPNQHRNAQDQPTRQQHLPQRPIPGVRIENRQIRRPEQLPR